MKRQLIKLAAAALAASMLLSVAACNKGGKGSGSGKSDSGKKITADMPWFDAKTVDVDIDYDKSRGLEYIYTQMAGADKDYVVTLTTGNYKMPTNIDWNNFNYNDYAIYLLTVIDRKTGESVNSFNLFDMMDEDAYPVGASYKNGVITVSTSIWDEKTANSKTVEIDVDPNTGAKLDSRDCGTGDGDAPRQFDLGDYSIILNSHWSENRSYYTVRVVSPDGESDDLEIKNGNKDIYYVSSIVPLSDTKIMIPADSDDGIHYYELDLKTYELKEADSKEYDWLGSTYLYNIYLGSDGVAYCSTPAGISKIDAQKKTMEEIFNFSWCNVSRNTLLNLELAEINDDSFVLGGTVYSSTPYSSFYDSNNEKFVFITFTKAAKNPHAGKKILELYASYGYVDDAVDEAIAQYNDTSKDYFIEVTDRYSNVSGINYSSYENDDDANAAALEYYNRMSNKLAMDVMNGDGPDMFLDVSYLGQLNSGNYLADLTPYLGNLDSNKYFTNIIDLAKVDGKLYNLPIALSVSGIHTDAQYAGASGTGFTTEEYQKFLKDVLNGEDVLTNGQANYFTTLFDNMSDKFIVNGKADFTGPEFAALAEYVKDNVREKAVNWDDQNNPYVITYDGSYVPDIKKAIYTSSYGFADYFRNLEELQDGNAILGLPSADGRGPAAFASSSIAVSAQACDVDACGEFIKILLSDEMQSKIAESGYFVLNREAFRKAGEGAIEYYNKHSINDMYYGGYDSGEGSNRVKFTTEHIDILEETILNCSIMGSSDSAVELILIEEMPAYFTGQKSLDEVAKVAQDRVQKVLDERG